MNKKSLNKDIETHKHKHKRREDKYKKKTTPFQIGNWDEQENRTRTVKKTQREMSFNKKDTKTKTDTKNWQRGKNAASGLMVV